jgi:hypothetical protein
LVLVQFWFMGSTIDKKLSVSLLPFFVRRFVILYIDKPVLFFNLYKKITLLKRNLSKIDRYIKNYLSVMNCNMAIWKTIF